MHAEPRRRAGDATPLTRTVLFSDVVRSTELIDEHGDLAWFDMVARHTSAVSAAATAHGGMISNFMGDGFMLIFDRPSDAIACAIRLQHEAAAHELLRLRIGIDHGDVYAFHEGWWVGLTIHVASRLTDLSQDGGIAISDRCLLAVEDALPCLAVEARLVAIRGLTEPCVVHLVDASEFDQPTRTRMATAADSERRSAEYPPACDRGRDGGAAVAADHRVETNRRRQTTEPGPLGPAEGDLRSGSPTVSTAS